MQQISAILVAILWLAFTAQAELTTYNATIDGNEREWKFYVPDNLPESPPLVFCLQGCCSDYNMWVTGSEYNGVADTAKIVVCYPEAINTSIGGQINNRDWDITGDRDLDFVLALIDTAVEKFNIDLKRVYATGFSYGGCFSNYLGCRYPEVFAAIAPSAGYVMTLQLKERTDCDKSRPVPVFHMHGTSDPIVSYSSGVTSVEKWVEDNECSEEPEITEHYLGSSTVKREYYSPCKDETEVIFLSAEGMGHAWMTESSVGVSAAVESWNFMSKYSLEPKVASERIVKTVPRSEVMNARYHAGSVFVDGVQRSSRLTLIDMKGSVIIHGKRAVNGKSLAVGSIAAGVYLLAIEDNSMNKVCRLMIQ